MKTPSKYQFEIHQAFIMLKPIKLSHTQRSSRACRLHWIPILYLSKLYTQIVLISDTQSQQEELLIYYARERAAFPFIISRELSTQKTLFFSFFSAIAGDHLQLYLSWPKPPKYLLGPDFVQTQGLVKPRSPSHKHKFPFEARIYTCFSFLITSLPSLSMVQDSLVYNLHQLTYLEKLDHAHLINITDKQSGKIQGISSATNTVHSYPAPLSYLQLDGQADRPKLLGLSFKLTRKIRRETMKHKLNELQLPTIKLAEVAVIHDSDRKF